MAITASSSTDPETEALKALLGSAGTTGAGAKTVYMGRTLKPSRRDEKYGLMPKDQADWRSEQEAMNDFYNWDDKKRRDFTAQLILAGMAPAGSGALEAEKAWQDLVKASSRYGAAGKEITPYDLLTGYVKAAGGAKKDAWKQLGAFEVNTVTGEKRYAGPGRYLGDGRAVMVDTRTDLTDPDTARGIATKLFQDLMGRDPQAGELSAFAAALNAAEASSPVTQTTTTQYDMNTGQQLSQQTASAGGVTAEGRAYIGEQQIKQKKEYGVNQSVTTYQGALESLIYGSQG
ncbi:hypothetical protein ACFUJU_07945 [Streptomyces sp. NPDC057235]|uniref:hypothetical protein n=1 Tax=Streptomyces sp. NPDC057235 TaxID=3346058 RepID=UPI003635FBBF